MHSYQEPKNPRESHPRATGSQFTIFTSPLASHLAENFINAGESLLFIGLLEQHQYHMRNACQYAKKL